MSQYPNNNTCRQCGQALEGLRPHPSSGMDPRICLRPTCHGANDGTAANESGRESAGVMDHSQASDDFESENGRESVRESLHDLDDGSEAYTEYNDDNHIHNGPDEIPRVIGGLDDLSSATDDLWESNSASDDDNLLPLDTTQIPTTLTGLSDLQFIAGGNEGNDVEHDDDNLLPMVIHEIPNTLEGLENLLSITSDNAATQHLVNGFRAQRPSSPRHRLQRANDSGGIRRPATGERSEYGL
ncbi:hypothetical protein F4778DRAFT_786520 [Xylariomycetidae sp. FL2044]|nr:hypothetical protein F4778DRAFT_786520 [Xylariomycetidae sp. FL2044]